MAIEDSISLIESRLAAVRPAEAEALAAGAPVAISRYVEGLSNDQELQGELEALGYSGPRLANFLLQAQLRRELEIYQARKAGWGKRFQAGDISEGEYRTLLERAGAEPDAIELEVALLAERPVSGALQSSEIFLSILSGEDVLPRPALAPSEIFLSMVEATEVREVTEVMRNTEISLAVLEASEVPPRIGGISSEIILTILAVEEV